ncbi:RNA polymerase sigma factor [Novosphingobium album (ex Liu et al. 2023)]|uniref:Sigma-70 family RNA polymerase sigma factor n=1 Tax=Novosphingobium album (ex Liu et al. 2023) TaxID=3031130 RepID=A0ABT5WJH1_9SPHN|nr:sigma-70 family RNA polymerase sigma factor [Novosphingobium album (ex Liu et al. 2023)]MDE8650190.1 sigma-70 family RNA polymerase sigma factor [Novosphingobium album (ex Liu et al. 2023)]
MADKREAVQWVAVHILRHEPSLRRWLRRTGVQASDIDDIVQQTYCKLSELDSVAHIIDARAYFFATARSFLLQRLRRDRVVHIQAASDQIDNQAVDQAPSPERMVGARSELNKVFEVIAALPKRYREVIELRRIEGLSQKETAKRLGLTEKSVENSLARGLKAILQSFENADRDYPCPGEELAEKVRNVGQR